MEIGILTISDSCHAGTGTDTSGPYLLEQLKILFPVASFDTLCVPDEATSIQRALQNWLRYQLVVCTGGTGLSQRDVTIKVLSDWVDRRLYSFTSGLIAHAMKYTSLAMLCEPFAGLKGNGVIVALPGSYKAV